MWVGLGFFLSHSYWQRQLEQKEVPSHLFYYTPHLTLNAYLLWENKVRIGTQNKDWRAAYLSSNSPGTGQGKTCIFRVKAKEVSRIESGRRQACFRVGGCISSTVVTSWDSIWKNRLHPFSSNKNIFTKILGKSAYTQIRPGYFPWIPESNIGRAGV